MFNSVVGDSYIEENAAINKVKNFSDCYLYSKGNYEKNLVEFILHSKYLDKNNEGYKNLIADVKRQKVSNSLAKMLESDNCILCVGEVPQPRAFKVFVAKDLRGDKKSHKLFIDVTGLIDASKTEYSYNLGHLNVIISYLLAGMNAMIYYVRPEKIINNTRLIEHGTRCFSLMMYYIIDYLRLSGDTSTRGKVMYLAARYYLINILQKPESDSVENWALKISGISANEAKVIDIRIPTVKNPNVSIATFVKALSEFFKNPKLTTEVVVDKWMYSFGNGSQFGLELYPAFAQIIIYAYVGAYLNNQKTIEKILGRELVSFVTEVMNVGSELI